MNDMNLNPCSDNRLSSKSRIDASTGKHTTMIAYSMWQRNNQQTTINHSALLPTTLNSWTTMSLRLFLLINVRCIKSLPIIFVCFGLYFLVDCCVKCCFCTNGFVVAPLPNKFLSLVFRTFGLTIRFDSSFSSMVDCYLRGDGVVGGFVFRAVSFVHGGFAVPPCDEVTRRVWLVDMFFWWLV